MKNEEKILISNSTEKPRETGELLDNELDSVSGGLKSPGGKTITTHANGCERWRCYRCDTKNTVPGIISGVYTHNCDKNSQAMLAICGTCAHMGTEKGWLICDYPNKPQLIVRN